MAAATNEQIRNAYVDWMHTLLVERSLAVTITFRLRQNGKPLAKHVTDEATRLFCRLLNTKAFGNDFRRGRRRLTIIPVDEGGRAPGDKHPHKHFLIEVPEGWDNDAWTGAVEAVAAKIDTFGPQCVIEVVRDEGWMNYMLKGRDKTSFGDAIDVANMWRSL